MDQQEADPATCFSSFRRGTHHPGDRVVSRRLPSRHPKPARGKLSVVPLGVAFRCQPVAVSLEVGAESDWIPLRFHGLLGPPRPHRLGSPGPQWTRRSASAAVDQLPHVCGGRRWSIYLLRLSASDTEAERQRDGVHLWSLQ